MMYTVIQNDKPPHDWLVINAYGTVISSGWDSEEEAWAEARKLKRRDFNQEDETRRQEVLRAIEEEADKTRKARDEDADKWSGRPDDEDQGPSFGP